MTALGGWIAASIGTGPPEAVVARMMDAFALGAAYSRSQTERLFALGVVGDAGERDHAVEKDCWAAIVGRPRWEDTALAALAAERGNAAALIAAYRRQGRGLLSGLKGWFALAVIEQERRRALLAIDRLGVGTLCYARPSSGGLVFGTRADIVAAHPAVDGEVSTQAVFNYLCFGVSPSPATVYRGQCKLLPGQCLFYENNTVATEFYWHMRYREGNHMAFADLSHELMERLHAAVGRLVADEVPSTLGAFLSGGLDSSTVAGLLRRAVRQPVKTFTVGFSDTDYDEVHYAEIVARHFGTEHRNYYLTPRNVADALLPLAAAFDEPFGNSSVVRAYYCAKTAREAGTSLMFAGDGGDEIFGGNSRYVEQLILEAYSLVPGALRRRLVEPIVLGTPGLDKLPLARKVRNYVRRARVAMPERLDSHGFHRESDLRRMFRPEFLNMVDVGEPLANLAEAYNRAAARSTLQRMLHLDLKITLADNDLRKVGVACALAGVRVAYPFLDDDVVEFSARVPPKLLIRRFQRRWFFKQAVRDFLPPETLEKRKHGFGMPFAEWPRNDPALRELADDCLEGFGRRPYLRQGFVKELRDASRDASWDGFVWDVIMLELWFRAHALRDRTPAREAAG